MSNAISAGSKRILFSAADSFTATNGYNVNTPGPGYIGSFGTGQATINEGNSQWATTISFGSSGTDWRVAGLHLTGAFSGSSNGQSGIGDSGNHLSQITILRNTIDATFVNAIIFNNFISGPGSGIATTSHDQIAAIENTITGTQSGSGSSYGIYASMYRSALLANKINMNPNSSSTDHGIRFHCGANFDVSHNILINAEGGQELAIRGSNASGVGLKCFMSNQPTGGTYFWHVGDNQFDNGTGVFPWQNFQMAPQNNLGATIEYIHDGVAERNYFVSHGATNQGIQVSGQRITLRDNIIDSMAFGSGQCYICVYNYNASGSVLVQDIFIYNNTAINRGTSPSMNLVDTTDTGYGPALGSGANVNVKNNIAYNLSSGFSISCGTGCSASNNSTISSPNPFVANPPRTCPAYPGLCYATDFKLASGAAPIGAGMTGLPVLYDFSQVLRSSPPSVGAWDLTGTSGGLGPPGQPVLVP